MSTATTITRTAALRSRRRSKRCSSIALAAERRRKLDALDAATIRERVLKRVRRIEGDLTTIQADEGVWESFSPKVKIKVLHRDVDTQSYLLKLEPGAVVLPHVHGQDEECMVLEGEVRIGNLVVKAGAYHLAPRGVSHEPISSENGALLFLRGAIPVAPGRSAGDAPRCMR